jgi:four helix bundle protein
MHSFEKLEIWRLSLDLIETIYETARDLSDDEKFGLTSQLRRASVSVCLNIAEGRASDSDAESRRFLGISLRSLIEIVACLKICERLKYLDCKVVNDVCQSCDKIEAKIRKFRNTLSNKRRTQRVSTRGVRRNASSVVRKENVWVL